MAREIYIREKKPKNWRKHPETPCSYEVVEILNGEELVHARVYADQDRETYLLKRDRPFHKDRPGTIFSAKPLDAPRDTIETSLAMHAMQLAREIPLGKINNVIHEN